MMLVTIEALKNLGGSATIQELDEKVIELDGVTEAEQTFTMPDENQTRVNYYLAWARTHLKRGNALVNSSRGVWALTERGAAIRGLDETGAIYVQVTQEERERARAKRQAAKAAKPDIVESTDNNPEKAEDWKSSLLAVALLHESELARTDPGPQLLHRLARAPVDVDAGHVSASKPGAQASAHIANCSR